MQLAINEASGLKVGAHLATEKSEYVYRCYLALGECRVIFNEISDAQSTPICKSDNRETRRIFDTLFCLLVFVILFY